MTTLAPRPDAVPRETWKATRAYVSQQWQPDSNPHHCVIAQTRSGKSTMIRRGILPMVPRDRVLILDSKGGRDQTWAGCGKSVRAFPSKLRRQLVDDRAGAFWYRLVIPSNTAEARKVVGDALNRVEAEGEWVVVFDEARHITDPPANAIRGVGLGLRGHYEALMMRGGALGVMCISGTQSPRWVPSSFYSQASFAWIGHLRDEAAHKRCLEIGGMTKSLLPVIATVPRYEFLLNADGGDYLRMVKPPAPPKVSR